MGVASIFGYSVDDEPDAGSRFIIAEKNTSVKRSLEVIRDATTGRLSIGGVEMGDTGWRKITALLNGWTGEVSIRRIGETVFINAAGITGSAASSGVFYTLPLGFKVYLSATSLPRILAHNTSSAVFRGFVASPGADLTISSYAGLTTGYVQEALPCSDDWPASLPGTPA